MKKNLGKIIALSLLTASVYTAVGYNCASAEEVTKSTTKELTVTSGDYAVDLESVYSKDFLTSGTLNAMNVNVDKANLSNVNIKLEGPIGYQARGLNIEQGKTITLASYIQNNKLIASTWYNGDYPNVPKYGSEVTSMYASNSNVTITGTTYINSIVTVEPGQEKKISVAHNGVYSRDKAVINLQGDTFINTNIPGDLKEAYEGNYGGGMSKNDAVTAKREGVVNINQAGGKKVQILGNLDVKGYEDRTKDDNGTIKNGDDKGGTLNIRLDTAESFWHGEEVRYDGFDGTIAEKADLNVTLANKAQWVPDKETTQISKITLEKDGIINMHGFNEHVQYNNGFTKQLTIGKLTTNGGIFRMDINAPAETYTGRNGSDFVFVKDGSGYAYVQPVLENKNDLSKITYDNPVWFADAADGITFKPYTVKEKIEKGFLYDYKPIVDQNVKTTDQNQYGNNWYLVGVAAENTPTTDTVIGAAAVDYATATARLEIDSLNKRLGELRDYDTAEKGAWVRFKAGEMEGDGPSYFNNKYRFYQIGYDAKENTNEEKDGRWHKGFAIHYTEGENSYLHGNGENTSRGASLYAGWECNKGHYADYVLKYSHLHNDFTSHALDGTADGSFSNYALSASVEYGRKNLMKHDWIFEPQTQLVYTYLSDADYSTSNRIQVSQDSVNSLIGRVGFRLGREYDQEAPERRSKWYVKADMLHEFCGDRDISLLSADGSQTLHESVSGHDTWFVWGLGGDIALDKNSYFYCDLERSFAGDIDEKWQANVGLRWEW